MYILATLTGFGTQKATCARRAECADLDTAVEMATAWAEEMGISTDARLVRSTVEQYGKYRHFAHRPCERGSRLVVLVPKVG